MEGIILDAQNILLGLQGTLQTWAANPDFPQVVMLIGVALALRGINSILH